MKTLARRRILLDEMSLLEQQGINCASCPGHCCTSVANSMQVTPQETADILNYLQSQGLWTDSLREKLAETVRKFRLEQPLPGNGKRTFLRRTYDCTFFAGQNLGCSLPPEVKPYGCLAFNANLPNETEGTSCRSNQELLLQQATEFPHEAEKLPLPLALLHWSR